MFGESVLAGLLTLADSCQNGGHANWNHDQNGSSSYSPFLSPGDGGHVRTRTADIKKSDSRTSDSFLCSCSFLPCSCQNGGQYPRTGTSDGGTKTNERQEDPLKDPLLPLKRPKKTPFSPLKNLKEIQLIFRLFDEFSILGCKITDLDNANTQRAKK